jgi:hypothetical protein
MADGIFNSITLTRQAEYKRTYDRLMERARGRVKEKGVHENHHIIPRSMGGSNEKSNIVALTYKEHFLAHWLLTKFTTGKARRAMFRALSKMIRAGRNNKNRLMSGWQYTIARRANSEAMVLWHKTPEGQEAAKKSGVTLSAFYATPEGQTVAKEAGKKGGAALRAFYATPDGQKVAKERGKKSGATQRLFWVTPEGQVVAKNRGKKVSTRLRAFYETPEGQEIARESGKKGGATRRAFYETPEGQESRKKAGKKIGATMRARGTMAGKNHPQAKVTEELVLKIRAFPGTRSEAAKHFGVSYNIAAQIMSGSTWKHLESVV